jgi:hypothetical protein
MARATGADWRVDHRLWIEAFVLANFGGLVFDIYLAHSANAFRRSSEYIPLYFSAVAPLVLLAGLTLKQRAPLVWKSLGYLVGCLAVLRSLTYAAPFAAPLAYAGLGLLLLVNRMIEPDDVEWSQWVVLLALGGFFGNFVFSLTDHAMNGFFNRAEWVPVVSSAFAVGFLLVPFLMAVTRRFLALCAVVLAAQAVVGAIGFVFHLRAVFRQPGSTLFERLLTGAPPMAPLLLPNLVILGLVGLWVLSRHTPVARSNAL